MIHEILTHPNAARQAQDREIWVELRVKELLKSAKWRDWTPEKGKELEKRVADGRHFGCTSPYEQAKAEFQVRRDHENCAGAIYIGAAGLPADWQERGIRIQTREEARAEFRQRLRYVVKTSSVVRRPRSLARSGARAFRRPARTKRSSAGSANDSGDDDQSEPPGSTLQHHHSLAPSLKTLPTNSTLHSRYYPCSWRMVGRWAV